MSVGSPTTEDEVTPEVETRDWGSYGEVFIEKGNTGGYIADLNGFSVNLDDWR